MFGINQTLHLITQTPLIVLSMVMAVSCNRDASQHQALKELEGLQDKMNAPKYRDNLEENLQENCNFFHQDNDPNLAKAIHKWFKNNNFNVIAAGSEPRPQFVAGFEMGCSFTIPIQPHRPWAVL